ncbi:hypothetical protein GCM10027418_07660 [Mariniluteicoccus endophyticus]
MNQPPQPGQHPQPDQPMYTAYPPQAQVAPPKKKGGCLKVVGAIVGGIVLLAILASVFGGGGDDQGSSSSPGSNSSAGSTSAPGAASTKAQAAAIEVTAKQLQDELKDNALGASNKYKGKRVKVTGTVSTIDSSGAYFTITGEEFSLQSIMCRINKDQAGQVAGFSKGQQVTVTGTITDVGEVMGYTLKTESIG